MMNAKLSGGLEGMSLDYIRRTYNVTAKRGMRVRYTDESGGIWNGRITSAPGAHLRILVDDRVDGYRRRLILHPTYNVEYMPSNVELRGCAAFAQSRGGRRPERT